MNKIAVMWPNRMRNIERVQSDDVYVCENVGVLNAASVAQMMMSKGVHAVVCTGGIEAEVRRVTNLPMYVVTSSYIDMLESFRILETEYDICNKRIALLLHKNNYLQMSRIVPYVRNEIKLFKFSDKDDALRVLNQIGEEGFDYVLTGPTGLTLSKEIHIPAYSLHYSEETALEGVKQVNEILDLNRKEVLQKTQLQSAIDVSPDAILSTDASGRIHLCNQKACEILHLSRDEILHQPIHKILTNISWEKVYTEGIPHRGILITIGMSSYFSTCQPIRQDGKIVGAVATLQEVEQIRTLESKFRSLQARGLTAKYCFEDILRASPQMQSLIEQAEIFAETEFTVLLEGETGTGKEMFAQSIHNASHRKSGPFVAVNCAALADSLLESELMGYEEGSFTGAKKGGKAGLFELAHNGTIFLDEINQMSLPLQSKLLRVIQERTVRHIGGDRMIPVNVRIIAATNEKLRLKVESGLFRNDLYYRLNIMRLRLPPLRERRGDIPLLMEFFAKKSGNFPCDMTALLKNVENYSWPGNVRELQNYVWRSVALLSKGVALDPRFLEEYMVQEDASQNGRQKSPQSISVGIGPLEEMENQIVREVVDLYGGNQSKAARVLKISRNTVNSKMKGV